MTQKELLDRIRAKTARVGIVGMGYVGLPLVRAFADAGATDFIGSIMPVGDDTARSAERTRTLLRQLVGKV